MIDVRSFLAKPHGSRKVVDLVYNNSPGYFLNMDPTSPIRVGDYGIVDVESGRLTVEGNIYTDFDDMEQLGIAQPETRDPEGKLVIMSQNTSRRDVEFDAGPDIAGGALNLKLRVKAEYTSGRSVTLSLVHPQSEEIPTPGRLARLVTKRELLHKVVVERVLVCPSYSLVVTGKSGGKVDVGFTAQIHTPVGGQGAALDGKWEIAASSEYQRSASFPTAECYVLYSLRSITRRGIKLTLPHRSPQHITDEEVIEPQDIPNDAQLRSFSVPWGILDEDGDDEFIDELDEFALAEVASFQARLGYTTA